MTENKVFSALERLRLWHRMPFPKNQQEALQACRMLGIEDSDVRLQVAEYWEPCVTCNRPRHACECQRAG